MATTTSRVPDISYSPALFMVLNRIFFRYHMIVGTSVEFQRYEVIVDFSESSHAKLYIPFHITDYYSYISSTYPEYFI